MKKQIVRRSLPLDYSPFSGVPEFLSRIYASRGMTCEAELDLSLGNMLRSSTLGGLDGAVSILVDALETGAKILVVGDFDADGATSTTLAVEALTMMGAKDCSYLVPDRFRFGYGLTPEIVDLAATYSPDILVTVDNGISSIEGVARAHELGMKVIVTDHHLPGDKLPQADAIVNPTLKRCGFPSKNLAGVGVIFYVLSALRTTLRNNDWFSRNSLPEVNMGDFLDLVALGTVADLVSLDYNNRILVEQGIRRIRAGRARPGILALFEVAGRSHQTAVTSDLGFAVGPRLNAAGRLDDMSIGIECLRSRDMIEAKERARTLHDLNGERKLIEQDMKRDADLIMSELSQEGDVPEQWGVVIYQPHWHQGVIGILASRVKEQLHRPVIAFAPESDDPGAIEMLKGSGRSVPGLHLRDALDLVAKSNPELLQKFGGHAMAAGMSIRAEDLQAFSEAFDQVAKALLDERDLQAVVYTDGELTPEDLTIESVELLERSGPWGQGFPEPRFEAVAKVVQSKVLKDKHLKMVIEFPDRSLMDAIQFSSDHCQAKLNEVQLVYRPAINDFRGRRSVQLLVDYIEPI